MLIYAYIYKYIYGNVPLIGVPFGVTLAIKSLLYTQKGPGIGHAAAKAGSERRANGERGASE